MWAEGEAGLRLGIMTMKMDSTEILPLVPLFREAELPNRDRRRGFQRSGYPTCAAKGRNSFDAHRSSLLNGLIIV